MPQSTRVQALSPASFKIISRAPSGCSREATTRPLKTTSSRWIGKKHVARASTCSFPPPERNFISSPGACPSTLNSRSGPVVMKVLPLRTAFAQFPKLNSASPK